MHAVAGVWLFFLVWTLTAVCQAYDDDVSVSCDDVTGTVGNQVIFTCSFSQDCSKCSFIKYKFLYPEKHNDSEICSQTLPKDSCEYRNTITCSFTPTTSMKEQFRFFWITKCQPGRAEFTVVITEHSSVRVKDGPPDTLSEETVIISSVVGSIVVILIIVLITIYFKKRCFGFVCSRMFHGIRQTEDNLETTL